jgi:hypothetical protein
MKKALTCLIPVRFRSSGVTASSRLSLPRLFPILRCASPAGIRASLHIAVLAMMVIYSHPVLIIREYNLLL